MVKMLPMKKLRNTCSRRLSGIMKNVFVMRQYHNFMFLAMTHAHTRSVAWEDVEMPWNAIVPQRRVQRTRMLASLNRSNFQFVRTRLQQQICNHSCLDHIHMQIKLPTRRAVDRLMHLLQYLNCVAFRDNQLGDYRPGSTVLEMELLKAVTKIKTCIAHSEWIWQRQHWKSAACTIA